MPPNQRAHAPRLTATTGNPTTVEGRSDFVVEGATKIFAVFAIFGDFADADKGLNFCV